MKEDRFNHLPNCPLCNSNNEVIHIWLSEYFCRNCLYSFNKYEVIK